MFKTLTDILNIIAASASAVAGAKAVYEQLKAAALQSEGLTPEQGAELDAKAEAIFNSPASKPSGR